MDSRGPRMSSTTGKSARSFTPSQVFHSPMSSGKPGTPAAQSSRKTAISDLDSTWGNDHDYYSLRIQDDFRDEGLQVIIKLSSIELTPEKPKYKGGNWHIEGMLNEHIAATALYYYDVDNVTESRISFRTAADLDSMDMKYEQGK